MNYSFYGGRRGAAFVIAESFPSVNAMVTAFKQGGNYTSVNYDEYVIIDTENKNDKDNGKVYRRGYDYTDDLGGAQYIGQIVGPSGPAPLLDFDHYNNVTAQTADGSDTIMKRTGTMDIDSQDLVPGKYLDGNVTRYNDDIQWATCVIRNANNTETNATIGLKIPYTVIDYTASVVSPYTTGNLIERTDDGSHPFYETWHLRIPKGVKGNTLDNLRVITASNSVQAYNGQEDDVLNNRKILVYDLYEYDNDANPVPRTYYVGDYNKIKDITLSENGTLTFKFDHDDDRSFSGAIKSVSRAEIVTGEDGISGNQKIKIFYNNDTSEEIGNPINYIIETAISDDYHYLVLYSDPAKRQEIVTAGKNATYPYQGTPRNDWYDMGSVRADSGILVGLNYDTTTVTQMSNISSAIQYLNSQWPSGLTGDKLQGKLVAAGDSNDNKALYAFDYSKRTSNTSAGYVGWFFMGNFAVNMSAVCGKETDNTTILNANSLPLGGIWFVTVEED